MKRRAAILGPTPQFVRWAVEQPCTLRSWDPESKKGLAEVSFRQLRSIRELSRARREGRVLEGIVVHAESLNENSTAPSLGFLEEEIWQVCGALVELNNACLKCPANALGDSGDQWAGCYGWLPANGSMELFRSIAEVDASAVETMTRKSRRRR